MVSESCGAVSEIQTKCCNAVRCPCFNHALNNSLAQASTIPSIRNTIGTLKAIIAFFNTSAKKHKLLTDTIGHKLIGLCQTRWVELHDGIIQFKKNTSTAGYCTY